MRFGLFYFAVLLIAASCSPSKRYYGNYYNKWRYWGEMFVLKKDFTFEYTNRTNAGTVSLSDTTELGIITHTTDSYLFSDSSYGTYTLKGDTVLLSYITDSIKGPFIGFNVRPERLYWHRKKLFFFFYHTNEPLRQKEYYMVLRKGKNPNLYRLDEEWVSPINK